MFQIILIKPNEFDINDIPFKTSPNEEYREVNRDNIFDIKSYYVNFDLYKEKLSEFIEVINVDESNFMETAVDKIELDDKHYGDVRDCYDEPNNIYQVMFRLISQYDNKSNLKNNILASLLTYEKELIYGNVILFKTNLPKDSYDMNNKDVTINELIKIVMNNIYHTGVYFESGKIEQIFYNNDYEIVDPLNKFKKRTDIDQIMKDEKYGFQKKDILKYNMQFIFDSESHDDINDPMSRLILGPIRGKGLISSPYENDNSFYDISKEEIIDLLKVSPNFELTNDDLNENSVNDNRKIVKNKYRILNFRLK